MAVTKEEFEQWIEEGLSNNKKYMISVCDSFSYEDFPVYAKKMKKLKEKVAYYDNLEMHRINEVIDLKTKEDIKCKI